MLSWRIAALFLLAPLMPNAARATVYEMADNGTVTIFRDKPSSAIGMTRPTALTPFRTPVALQAKLERSAARYQLSGELIAAVVWAESRFRPQARSAAGAIGLMQLMPATARQLAVDPHNVDENIRGGTAYLRQLLNRYDGDLVRALAAYNAGPGAVDRYGGIPPFRETRAYVATILARLAALPPA
jgi:soluble lytic murein transglycosylase-like protein